MKSFLYISLPSHLRKVVQINFSHKKKFSIFESNIILGKIFENQKMDKKPKKSIFFLTTRKYIWRILESEADILVPLNFIIIFLLRKNPKIPFFILWKVFQKRFFGPNFYFLRNFLDFWTKKSFSEKKFSKVSTW